MVHSKWVRQRLMMQDAVIRNLEIIFDSLAVVGVVGAVGASRCINVRCEN
ncbi:hypothetical protein [Coleofasciculus sp.]